MQDLMIDLETLATSSKAVVISIGAVFFDPEKEILGPSYYRAITIKDQMKLGREIDPDTLKWWMQQEDAAKKVFNEKAIQTSMMLNEFRTWTQANSNLNKVQPWGNGSHFDISIMESLYNDFSIGFPWKFYNVMDLRTFRRFVGNSEKVEKSGVNHNALDDAIAQAKYVIKHYKEMKL